MGTHVTGQPAFFPPHPIPGGLPSRREGPPCIWDTHGISGNVFANPPVSSSALHPQESNAWFSNQSEHTSPNVMSEKQTQVQDQRCQSGPSAKNSIPSEGDSLKNYGADQQRLQISDLHFNKFPTPATLAFTISYGNDASGQRSGDGVPSVDDFKSFVICKRNSNARF